MLNETDAIISALEKELSNFASQRSPEFIADHLSHGAYVYGAGGYGQRVAAHLIAAGYPCLGFLDRAAKPAIDGIPVVSPDSLSREHAAKHAFVLGIHNHYLDVREIIAYAKSMGFRQIILNADLPDALGSGMDNYWLGRRSFLLENFDKIRATAKRFSDPASLALYCDILRFRITGDYAFQPPHDLSTQYLPPDLPGFAGPITLVDGGAYTGDSYRAFRALGQELKHWIAFEPDPANFTELADCARVNHIPATLFPCGLSDRLHLVQFLEGQTTGSRIAEAGTAEKVTSILCVALDEVVQSIVPDYIKLDIEGAEQAALLGMAKTIAEHQPRLAVSAYHLPQDLWEIPDTLARMLPRHSLHLRQHGFSGFDTVAYAIPK